MNTPKEFKISPMIQNDIDESISFWKATEGMGLSGADTVEGIRNFLERNPALSLVARIEGKLIGTILCGHDGRRGYLHHLAVANPYRKMGLGRLLSDRCLQSLGKLGIQKCHLFVIGTNAQAIGFWKQTGWVERSDLCMMSKDIVTSSID